MSAVEGLVPFVHVLDVVKSSAFYELFGFEVRNTFERGGRRVWCWLDREFGIADPDGYVLMVTDAAALSPPPRR